ncbi:restriction endonuclease subunit S [Polyangium sp. 6x1]|uniref:restriction endonuclease subunit S n=1 Tax=Polyangium sp. 6x1 TaxID=3042689 RepID=UPI0024826DC9|nr:restriction endonuclease subunit S [Polyangium sp. 6x1]MDI1445955.1 restriction endonuclease subunit S [Polyangium sp. 6x1]
MAALIDYRGKSPTKTTSGIPLVTAKVIKDGRILAPDEFIDPADYDSWMRRGIPQAGDVVMTTEAPLGEIAELNGEKVALAQRVITLRGDRNLLAPKFLKYLMLSDGVQEQLRARATGTTVLGIRQSELRKVALRLPPLNEQRSIASLLGVLDDKLELNRRMNRTLEALASALFKSWFVDFDPVQAKRVGRSPVGVPDAALPLLPKHFEDSELGPIPQGWTTCPLDSIAEFLNGLALQNFPPDDGPDLPVIKIAQLRAGTSAGAERASAGIPAEYVIHDGDVIFSWSGSLLVDVWCGGPGALNQHLFKVTSQQYPKWFYLHWVKEHLLEFQAIAADKATTMGHIRRHHLTDARVVVPKGPLLSALSQVQEPLLAKLVANRVENRTLETLRDTLLPALLSGEVTIKQADKAISKVV